MTLGNSVTQKTMTATHSVVMEHQT